MYYLNRRRNTTLYNTHVQRNVHISIVCVITNLGSVILHCINVIMRLNVLISELLINLREFLLFVAMTFTNFKTQIDI